MAKGKGVAKSGAPKASAVKKVGGTGMGPKMGTLGSKGPGKGAAKAKLGTRTKNK